MSEGAETITLVLADDHAVVRSGLRIVLESDGRFAVLGEAGDLRGTVETVLRTRPQVLVLDLNLGGESGLDAIRELRATAPDTQIVVLTMHREPAFARAALQAGALGYVLKDAADRELIEALLLAARTQPHVAPQLRRALSGDAPDHSPAPPDHLSPRELEVLSMIALGHTNPEIAAALSLSVRTVESHRAHVQQKLGITSRAELVEYARQRGLVD